MDNLKMILFDGTELSTDDRNPLPEHMRNGVFLHLICMPCPFPLNRWEGACVRKYVKRPGNNRRGLFLCL